MILLRKSLYMGYVFHVLGKTVIKLLYLSTGCSELSSSPEGDFTKGC